MHLDQPDAASLLAAARELLQQELLPVLPPSQRYAGLMLANAIAIAGRECAEPDDADAAAREAARDLVTQDGQPPPADLDGYLARALRDGRLAPQAPGLHRLLLEQTLRRLRLSNPKYLEQHRLE